MIGRSLQEALNDWAIGFSLGQGRGISILVHCGGNVRMSHEFLLYAHGCSGLVQPRTICVTERVKPDPAKSRFQTCRNQIVGANRVGVITVDPSLDSGRQRPLPSLLLRNRIQIESTPVEQQLEPPRFEALFFRDTAPRQSQTTNGFCCDESFTSTRRVVA